jgi:hypothetical protein
MFQLRRNIEISPLPCLEAVHYPNNIPPPCIETAHFYDSTAPNSLATSPTIAINEGENVESIPLLPVIYFSFLYP